VRRSTLRRVILLPLTLGIGLYLAYGFMAVARVSGAIYPNVRLVSATPIRVAGVEAIGRPDGLEYPIEFAGPNNLRYPVPDEGLRGVGFQTRVPTGSTINGFGCEYGYYQFRFLAVVADLADGRRVRKVVELPDVRTVREVTVALD
jgi:hypothetical protein